MGEFYSQSKNKFIFSILICLLLTSCYGTHIIAEDLPNAYIDEAYEYQIKVEESGWGYAINDELVFALTGGELPEGMAISLDGELLGTPQTAGVFEFHVTVYNVYDGGFFYEDEFDYRDSQWFTLVVEDEL